MSKQQDLRKKTVKTTVMASIVVAVAGILYAATSFIAGGIATDKTTAEGKLNADNGLLSSLREQMDKSGAAEKRYVIIQEGRTSPSPETDIKALKEFLANAKLQYKFDDLKIKPVIMAVSDKPELVNFNYNVQVWNRFRITLKAVSDVHIFSFLEYFRSAIPGFVRIDSLELKRVSDLTDQSLTAIRSAGTMPLNVEAKIEFTWIGLSSKEKNAIPNPSTP